MLQEGFLDRDLADLVLNNLQGELANATNEVVRCYGQTHVMPRRTRYYLRGYTFSRTEHKAEVPPLSLLCLKAMVEERTGVSFNSMSVVHYEGGKKAGIDKHVDKGVKDLLVVLSLGAPGCINWWDRKGGRHTFLAAHGDLYTMAPNTPHQIPKKRLPMGRGRVAIVFRQF